MFEKYNFYGQKINDTEEIPEIEDLEKTTQEYLAKLLSDTLKTWKEEQEWLENRTKGDLIEIIKRSVENKVLSPTKLKNYKEKNPMEIEEDTEESEEDIPNIL
jgi:hypothetical protein